MNWVPVRSVFCSSHHKAPTFVSDSADTVLGRAWQSIPEVSATLSEEVEGEPGEGSSPREDAVPVYFQGLAVLHKLAVSTVSPYQPTAVLSRFLVPVLVSTIGLNPQKCLSR